MEDSTEPEAEPTTNQETEELVVDVNIVACSATAFSESITQINKVAYADKRQKGGRWAPAFPETSLEKQEAYIERMLARDKELNLG